jgi:hypothetical protein
LVLVVPFELLFPSENSLEFFVLQFFEIMEIGLGTKLTKSQTFVSNSGDNEEFPRNHNLRSSVLVDYEAIDIANSTTNLLPESEPSSTHTKTFTKLDTEPIQMDSVSPETSQRDILSKAEQIDGRGDVFLKKLM